MTSIDNLWDVEDVSLYLRIPVATLYQWRHLGTGPKSRRIGRYLRYVPEDVVSWVRKQE